MDAIVNKYGLIGSPISHSFSPLIFNKAFLELDINSKYDLLDVQESELESFFHGEVIQQLKGFNVTTPLKRSVIPYMDTLSTDAEALGAVNTVMIKDGNLVGYNTDIYGFSAPLQKFQDDLKHSNALLFGAGGAARAVATALVRDYNISALTIINRSQGRADEFSVWFSQLFPSIPLTFNSHNSTYKIIINATNVGRISSEFIGGDDFFNKQAIVYDLVYNPIETEFLKKAKQKEAKVIYGFEMLLYQAERAFELWTQQKMPTEVIRSILEKKLDHGANNPR